jgi:hypothetical protein
MRWFSVMPLLDLRPGATSTHVADFLHIGVEPSLALDRTKRIASLSAAARQRVQQRVIYHLTRLAVPLHDLAMQTRAVERELELQASWCERACEHSSETADVVAEVNREIRQRYTNRPQ